MTEYILSNLPRQTLDPRNEQELLEKALATVASASEGQLTDFSSSSVVGNIIKGQVFAHMELKWYLNKVVVAIAIELLRLFGVVRSLGTPSRGEIAVVLKNTLLTPYVLPEGYRLPYRNSEAGRQPIEFITTEQLTIPPGATSGYVGVIASRPGIDTNIPALGYYVGQIGTYINYVYNETPIEGGTDIEPLEETVARGQRAIRTRTTLVSAPDYEEAAKIYLGYGSNATCFPNMDSNYEEGKMGNVHVICSLPNGEAPQLETCAALRSSLLSRSFAAASVWVSPIKILPCIFDIVINVRSLEDVSDTSVLDTLNAYLLSQPLGKTVNIKELEFITRLIPGVTRVQYVTLNGDALDTAMPDKTYVPRLVQLTLTKVDELGVSLTSYPESLTDPD